mgnify:CR=1 FL=1
MGPWGREFAKLVIRREWLDERAKHLWDRVRRLVLKNGDWADVSSKLRRKFFNDSSQYTPTRYLLNCAYRKPLLFSMNSG